MSFAWLFVFHSFLLIIDDTDLSRRATGACRFQSGDPGSAEGEQLAARRSSAPRGAACGALPTAEQRLRSEVAPVRASEEGGESGRQCISSSRQMGRAASG